VAGCPILGSRSPGLYTRLLAASDVEGCYTRLAVDTAHQALGLGEALCLDGMNITAPLKAELPALLAGQSDAAMGAGAVNLVLRTDGGWWGDNTDIHGVRGALEVHGVLARGRSALVLGGGGAARAAGAALRRAGVHGLLVANRTRRRGELLAAALGASWVPLDQLEMALRQVDIVVSCVSTDSGLVRASWLRARQVVLDADYQAGSLERAAHRAGCRFIPGSDWLALQAAASFERFTDRAIGADQREHIRRLAAQAPRRQPRRVALAGFMGCGKSSLAPALARRLGWQAMDTDRMVEQQAGQGIPGIFSREGEAGFRARESRALCGALALDRCVIALGGGALEEPANRRLLSESALVVLLWGSLQRLQDRATSIGRPLLRAGAEPAALLQRRLPRYLAAADLVMPIQDSSPEQLAARLEMELSRAGLGA